MRQRSIKRTQHKFIARICASAALAITSSASAGYSTLITFDGSNGLYPSGDLIIDNSGNLYGSTSGFQGFDLGRIYKIDAGTAAFSTLATFTTTTFGVQPRGRLLRDSSGNLFGTTTGGGANSSGTVFKVAAGTNTLSALVSLDSTNGSLAMGGVIADASNNLYGTAYSGGTSSRGTVFKVAAGTNALSTKVLFNDTNGKGSVAGLIADTAGNFYGTTESGGTFGAGTIFKLDASNNYAHTVLHSFSTSEAHQIDAPLALDSAGNLYGTGYLYGSTGFGAVFKFNPTTNTLTNLAVFNGTNGNNLKSGVIVDASGKVFGTSFQGGANGFGTIFSLAPTNNYSVSTLFNFTSATGPTNTGLIADAAGNLYGTSSLGSSNRGTVFKFTDASFAVPASNATWASQSGGDWDLPANWTGSIPNAGASTATFGPSITAPATVTVPTLRILGAMTFNSVNAYTLTGGTVRFGTNVNVLAGNHVIQSAAQMYTTNFTVDTAAGSSVAFTGSIDGGNAFITKTGAGKVTFASMRVVKLTAQAGTVAFTRVPVIDIYILSGTPAAPTARLDVTDSGLVIGSSFTLSQLNSLIIAGRGTTNANGVYSLDGMGITSSTAAANNAIAGFNKFAVAAIKNSDLNTFNGAGSAYTTFGGINVGAAASLVRYTYNGDANLDGKIDAADYSLINRGAVGTIANVGWLSGDFNLDGAINATDYSIIDFGYLKQGAALTLESPVAVPEPASLALMTIGSALMLCRRAEKSDAKRCSSSCIAHALNYCTKLT